MDQNEFKNYRPVSNLSFLSKVLERVVLDQLFEYLNQNNLLSPNQSAYRPGHSTETALIKVTNDILTSLDQGDVTVLSLLDLSSAFDTLDHSILFNILQNDFKITDTALNWFKDYLTCRSQSVNICNSFSNPSSLKYGVPQGSVLGPVLFIMYTKSLHNIIRKYSVSDQSFADDTQLYQSCRPIDIDNTILNIENCISDVKSWMQEHKLKLNDSKTETMLINSSVSFKDQQKPDSITIGSTEINFSSTVRNLGFIMSDTMTVDSHINNVCRSCYAALRRISAIRQYLTVHSTTILVCAFVLSRLDYTNALLIGSPKYTIEKLQKVQNAAARLIFKSRKHDHITPLLKTLHWLPVHLRIQYKIAVLCFNFFQGSSPYYISNLLSIYTPTRPLRSSLDTRILRIPSIRTKTFGSRSFSYAAPNIWNSLPHVTRHAQSISSFKHQLKTLLFQQYFD